MKSRKSKAGSMSSGKHSHRTDKTSGRSKSMPARGNGPGGSGQSGCCQRFMKVFKGMTEGTVLLVFLVLLVTIILVLGIIAKNNQQENSPEDQAEAIGDIIETDLKDGTADMDYEEIKQQLKEQGIEKEFAWHLEDQNGNLIQVEGKPCSGSPQASVNGQECS